MLAEAAVAGQGNSTPSRLARAAAEQEVELDSGPMLGIGLLATILRPLGDALDIAHGIARVAKDAVRALKERGRA